MWIPSERLRQRFGDDREGRADLRRQRAAVGVAQHDPLGARLGGGAQAVERVAGVEREAVEEVLGVEAARACRRRAGRRPSRRSSRGSPRATRARPSRRAAPRPCPRACRPARSTRRARAGPRPRRRSRRAGGSCRRRRSPRPPAARRRAVRTAPAPWGWTTGKPASIMCTPSSSSAWTTRTFSSAVRLSPPPPMPSRRVASYSCMSAIGATRRRSSRSARRLRRWGSRAPAGGPRRATRGSARCARGWRRRRRSAARA